MERSGTATSPDQGRWPLSGPRFATRFLMLSNQAAGLARGVVHGTGERQEPLDLAVRVDAAVGPLVRVGRAGEEQVHAARVQFRDQFQESPSNTPASRIAAGRAFASSSGVGARADLDTPRLLVVTTDPTLGECDVRPKPRGLL